MVFQVLPQSEPPIGAEHSDRRYGRPRRVGWLLPVIGCASLLAFQSHTSWEILHFLSLSESMNDLRDAAVHEQAALLQPMSVSLPTSTQKTQPRRAGPEVVLLTSFPNSVGDTVGY